MEDEKDEYASAFAVRGVETLEESFLSGHLKGTVSEYYFRTVSVLNIAHRQ